MGRSSFLISADFPFPVLDLSKRKKKQPMPEDTTVAEKELLDAGYSIERNGGLTYIRDEQGRHVIISRVDQEPSYAINFAYGVMVSRK